MCQMLLNLLNAIAAFLSRLPLNVYAVIYVLYYFLHVL